jgi:hypothetical protein
MNRSTILSARVAARHLAATKRVTYNGRPYTLLWSGPTKHGERAHLQFIDGTKDFWVDSFLVSGASASHGATPKLRRDGTYECDECGDYVRPGTRCWETGRTH